jgi:hypothetical protein
MLLLVLSGRKPFYIYLSFKDNPGYLPAMLYLWSQAQPCGIHHASPPFVDLSSFKLQG